MRKNSSIILSILCVLSAGLLFTSAKKAKAPVTRCQTWHPGIRADTRRSPRSSDWEYPYRQH